MHSHGGEGHPDHDSHGGSRGPGWEFLDAVMLGCFVVLCGLLAEILYRDWKARRVRYDLTPEGRAAATGRAPAAGEGVSLIDEEALKDLLERERAKGEG